MITRPLKIVRALDSPGQIPRSPSILIKWPSVFILLSSVAFIVISQSRVFAGDLPFLSSPQAKTSGYIHKGVIKTNGLVDTSRVITDRAKLAVRPLDEGQHADFTIGNFDIWYFDVIDSNNKCSIMIQFYFDTGPLRKNLRRYVTIFTHTREFGIQNKVKAYSSEEFNASREYCDVMIGENRVYAEYPPDGDLPIYHLHTKIEELKVDLTFRPELEGWKPWGDKIRFRDKEDEGAFSWLVPVPKARVNGTLVIGDRKYEIKEAFGYYDRNYWNKNELFVDDVITSIEWGRFISEEYTIVFGSLQFRPWLKQPPIRSLLIVKDNEIIHSSNNLVKIIQSEFEEDKVTATKYPTKIIVESIQADIPFISMEFRVNEMIEKKDYLDGLDSFTRLLIRRIFGKPAAYWVLADATVAIPIEGGGIRTLEGPAFYALLIIDDHVTAFGDWVRRLIR